jgi:uncharacterized integral membrane protein
MDTMFALILIVILGLGMALFAQQNTQTVSLTVGLYSFAAVPIYVVVILSVLVGLFVAWILSVMDFFSHSVTLRRKDSALGTAERRVATLEEKLADLRDENARLRGEKHAAETHHTEHTDDTVEHRSFFEQMRDKLAHRRREEAIS